MLDFEQLKKIVDEAGPDLSAYERAPLADLSEGEELPTEDELLKSQLIQQIHTDRFGPDDPRGDDEIYSEVLGNEAWKIHTVVRGDGS
jgi:hypothetical protein